MTRTAYRRQLRAGIAAAKRALSEEMLKPYWPDYERRIRDFELCLKAVK